MQRSTKRAFVAVVAAILATMPVLAADSPKPRSQVFSGETLRMPRFLKHPLIFQLSPTDRVTIYRTPQDTCGLYTWGVFTVSNGGGPVPHIHYADKEWFLTENQGGIRVFLPKDPLPSLVPGQVPGLNGPSQAMGSTLLPSHAALFSRQGIVHYYTNESGERLSGFHNVWAPGYGMIGVFQVFDQAVKRGQPLDPQELMAQTGLWGTPHDSAGVMVGTSDYRKNPGPGVTAPTNLKQLQALIDKGESCFTERQPEPPGVSVPGPAQP